MTDETKKADHCMHVAALWWTQAAFWDALDAEAVRRGHPAAQTGRTHDRTRPMLHRLKSSCQGAVHT
jgi:hypothetical protein